jgi:hypothetical protein
MEMRIMKTIWVQDISSISESIFSFKSKNGVIKEEPFRCKQKQEKNAVSSYHFDKDDLVEINKYYNTIYPYNPSSKITKSQYIDNMKQQFYLLIKENQMPTLLSRLYKISVEDIEVKWDPKKEPKFKI